MATNIHDDYRTMQSFSKLWAKQPLLYDEEVRNTAFAANHIAAQLSIDAAYNTIASTLGMSVTEVKRRKAKFRDGVTRALHTVMADIDAETSVAPIPGLLKLWCFQWLWQFCSSYNPKLDTGVFKRYVSRLMARTTKRRSKDVTALLFIIEQMQHVDLVDDAANVEDKPDAADRLPDMVDEEVVDATAEHDDRDTSTDVVDEEVVENSGEEHDEHLSSDIVDQDVEHVDRLVDEPVVDTTAESDNEHDTSADVVDEEVVENSSEDDADSSPDVVNEDMPHVEVPDVNLVSDDEGSDYSNDATTTGDVADEQLPDVDRVIDEPVVDVPDAQLPDVDRVIDRPGVHTSDDSELKYSDQDDVSEMDISITGFDRPIKVEEHPDNTDTENIETVDDTTTDVDTSQNTEFVKQTHVESDTDSDIIITQVELTKEVRVTAHHIGPESMAAELLRTLMQPCEVQLERMVVSDETCATAQNRPDAVVHDRAYMALLDVQTAKDRIARLQDIVLGQREKLCNMLASTQAFTSAGLFNAQSWCTAVTVRDNAAEVALQNMLQCLQKNFTKIKTAKKTAALKKAKYVRLTTQSMHKKGNVQTV